MPESGTEVRDVWFFSPDEELNHWERGVTITTVDGLIQPLESRGTRWNFSHTDRKTTSDGDSDTLVFVPRLVNAPRS